MPGGIVVVGGGFAGYWAAVAARRAAGAGLPIELVSRHPWLELRPRLYQADPATFAVEIRDTLARVGVELVVGEATGIDVEGRRLLLAGADGRPYERIVVATGSELRRPALPGAGDAFSIDTVADAVAFDRRLAELGRVGAEVPVVIVGAGFAGVELALEMRDRLSGHWGAQAGGRARIVLVDRADRVGAELGPGPRPVIEAALARASIETWLGAEIVELGADRCRLADGRAIDGGVVVLVSGMQAAPFVASLPGERDELGRLVVDVALRAPAAAGVFVAGDAAAADGGDGVRALQSCQHALQMGRFAGMNAALDLLGLPLHPYVQPGYVTCLDLGRSGGLLTTGWERTVSLTGAEGKAEKEEINTVVIPPPGPEAEARQILERARVHVW